MDIILIFVAGIIAGFAITVGLLFLLRSIVERENKRLKEEIKELRKE